MGWGSSNASLGNRYVSRDEYSVDANLKNHVSVPKITLKQLFDALKTSAVARNQNSVSVSKITLKQLFDEPKKSADAKHQKGVFVTKITLK